MNESNNIEQTINELNNVEQTINELNNVEETINEIGNETTDETTDESTNESTNESIIDEPNSTDQIVNDNIIDKSDDNPIIHNSDIKQTIDNGLSSGVALTTFDNPYDPFDQFTLWFMFDVERGYNTCAHLARIAKLSDDMSDEEVDIETERAIDEIIEYDFMNIYKKIKKNTSEIH